MELIIVIVLALFWLGSRREPKATYRVGIDPDPRKGYKPSEQKVDPDYFR